MNPDFEAFAVVMTVIRKWLTADIRLDADTAMVELSQLSADVKAAVECGDHMVLHWDARQIRPYFGDEEHMQRVVTRKIGDKTGDNVLAVYMRDDRIEDFSFVIGRLN